jgi:hypothetical protein
MGLLLPEFQKLYANKRREDLITELWKVRWQCESLIHENTELTRLNTDLMTNKDLLKKQNKELSDNVKVKDWKIRTLSDEIATLQNKIASSLQWHSVESVLAPRMLACQNPYMIH